MSYQTSFKRSPPFWLLIGARKLLCFSAQSEVRTAVTVWNWSGKTLSPGALLPVLYFSSCHIFPPIESFPRHYYLPLGLRGCSLWRVPQIIVKYASFCKVFQNVFCMNSLYLQNCSTDSFPLLLLPVVAQKNQPPSQWRNYSSAGRVISYLLQV